MEPENAAPPSSKPLFTLRVSRKAGGRILIAILLVILLLILARVFHFRNWGLTAQQVQAREVAAMVQKVGALMLVPSGETPVMATVTDAASLKSQQQFYADAQNGDVLLVYAKAERAILYRPSSNKIINVGPIYLNPNAQDQAQTAGSANAPATSSGK